MNFNTIHLLLLVFLLLPPLQVGAWQKNDPIVKTIQPAGWIIRTRSSAYRLIITQDGHLRPVYYGPKIKAHAGERIINWNKSHIDEVPARDGHPVKTPALEVLFPDGVRDVDLKYDTAAVTMIDHRPVLKIIETDRYYPLELTTYIRVLPEHDILEKWITIKNTGDTGNIKVENLLSGSIVLPEDEYMLTQLSGKQMSEFQLYHGILTPGLKLIENKTFKSNDNPPWFAVKPKYQDHEKNPVWFGTLHYSGNWVLKFDKKFDGGLQVLGGINFWDTDWQLNPGESFTTPKFSIGFTEGGEEEAARDLAGYIQGSILPTVHRKDLRPVIFNGYYGTGLNVNEKDEEALAKAAADLGVEMFVIDDGWFKNRTDHNSGLGDWTVDDAKFPHGLNTFIQKVHGLGMKFGLWFEPENVDVNSDLYRAHPDWALRVPHRTGNTRRRILNLAKPEVYHYLLERMTALLRENDIDYIKWDQNNFLSDAGWPDAPGALRREVRLRYVDNLYRLVDELKQRFPEIWFESCSSGGGRVDLGMMSRMDLAWISDNTFALNRIFIQYGYLGFMPANTMLSFVVDKIGNLYHQPTSLDYRFDVAMSGVLGISTDIRKWTPEEKALARKKIQQYKLIRPLIQKGILYRLVSPFETNRCALEYNSPDTTASVVFCYNMAQYLPGSQVIARRNPLLKLRGLQPDAKYRLKDMDDPGDQGVIYTGAALRKAGMEWPVKETNDAKLFILQKIDL